MDTSSPYRYSRWEGENVAPYLFFPRTPSNLVLASLGSQKASHGESAELHRNTFGSLTSLIPEAKILAIYGFSLQNFLAKSSGVSKSLFVVRTDALKPNSSKHNAVFRCFTARCKRVLP